MSKTFLRQLYAVGLGCVGLILTVAFVKYLSIVGFNVNDRRIADLKHTYDHNSEVSLEALWDFHLHFITDPTILREPDFI